MTTDEEELLNRLHRTFGQNLEVLTTLTTEQATPFIYEFCLRDTAKAAIVFEVPDIDTGEHVYKPLKFTYFV